MLTPPQTMQDVLEILARIEKQQQEILSRLTPKASRKYLTVEEAAGRLDRSAWTVRQLCNLGLIRAVKGEDKTWRIPADEVARLEEEGAPKLPTAKTPAPFLPSARRGKGDGNDAALLRSDAPSTSL
jgi:excisionase family DNA binding protein